MNYLFDNGNVIYLNVNMIQCVVLSQILREEVMTDILTPFNT